MIFSLQNPNGQTLSCHNHIKNLMLCLAACFKTFYQLLTEPRKQCFKNKAVAAIAFLLVFYQQLPVFKTLFQKVLPAFGLIFKAIYKLCSKGKM